MGLGKTVTTLTAIEELKNDYMDIKSVGHRPEKSSRGYLADRVSEVVAPDGLEVMRSRAHRKKDCKPQQPADIYIITRTM